MVLSFKTWLRGWDLQVSKPMGSFEFCSEERSESSPEIFKDFSCSVSLETGTTKDSPKTPAMSQCQIRRQFQRNNSQIIIICQRDSRRLWRSQRRKSRSVPEGGADLPATIVLAGKCPNLDRDSIWCCRKIGEEFSSSVEICRKTFPAENFRGFEI